MTSSNTPSPVAQPVRISARRARRLATLFNVGNLIAVLVPLPLGVLWGGGSIALYTLLRHHPNERVGYYTQWAAYRFYGLLGFVIIIATFFGKSVMDWLITWAVFAIILVPWTIYDLIRIYRENWQDTLVEEEKA